MKKTDTATLSDEVLVQKSLKDVSFFEALLQRYETKLKYYVLRLSNISELEAEDILQEAFLKAWKNLNGFDPSLKFSSWMYRIAHNETISFSRAQKARRADQTVDIDDEVFAIRSKDPELSELLDQKLQAETVRQILDLLPEKFREVLVLKFLEDQSYEAISDILKKPMGTVATLLSRAKQAFKELYERQN